MFFRWTYNFNTRQNAEGDFMNNSTTSITQKTKWNVLSNINAICDSIVDSSLNPERTTLYQTTLLRLNEYFNTNENQTWILCFSIYQHFRDNNQIYPSEFADFLSVNVLKVAAMYSEFVALRQKGLIDFTDSKSTFSVSKEVIKTVLHNEILPHNLKKETSYLDFVAKAANLYENNKYTEKSTDDLVCQLKEYEDSNETIPFVIRCRELISDSKSRFMFYDLCNDSLSGLPSCLCSTIDDIYDDSDRFIIARNFLEEEHILIKTGLVKFTEKGNLIDSKVTLTEKGKKFFLDDDYGLYAEKVDDKKLKKPQDIHAKKLFYSEENQKQINNLTQSLTQSKFRQIQKKLTEKGLPCGIAVILHGAAGCGKTETVYQLAKKTGRAIMQVDISDTKSAWFGESEKKIKEVFTDYKNLCEKMKKIKGGRIPILLFNECDAVFSKRKDISWSNTAQTENAIQNIILEEMEKLEGIMIATTNLIDNLDPAFERRFLFKIHFENPSVEAKKAIWKNKMKWMSPAQAEELAINYNLSGGEIDNIVRKAEMKEIISGKRPAFSDIVEMCKVEKLETTTETTKRMGFAV